jgi:hypothetical protein
MVCFTQAMNFNFGQARIAKKQGMGGETIMRFDDTNPVSHHLMMSPVCIHDFSYIYLRARVADHVLVGYACDSQEQVPCMCLAI